MKLVRDINKVVGLNNSVIMKSADDISIIAILGEK
jgi:hypothetical protein